MTDDLNRPKSAKSAKEAKRLASDRARIGQLISGRYELLDLLGRGGMGAVYKARHLSLERIVAIKFLLSDVADDPEMRQRFLREASASGKINHPNVVELIDYGEEEDGCMYIVMEFLDGVGLDRVIKNEGALPAARAINIFDQICTAVAKAHAKGIIHRDLKPSNVMLVREHGKADFVKIVDFGLAKAFETGEESQRLTQSGEVFGSPIYMSPEQCLGQVLDARSDVYSLGILMYETLTAKVPFLGAVMAETIARHLQESPRSFVDMRPDLLIPEQLEAVVMKAISKDPDERQASMLVLKDELADPDLLIFQGGRAPSAPGIKGGDAAARSRDSFRRADGHRAGGVRQGSGSVSGEYGSGGVSGGYGSGGDNSGYGARGVGGAADENLAGTRAQNRLRNNSASGSSVLARLQSKMSSPVLAIGCLLSSLMLAAGVYLVLGSMQHPSPRSSSSANKTAISKQASNSPTPNKNDPGSANSITVKNDSGTANSTASTANSTAQKSSSNIDAEDAAKKTDTTSGAKESNLVREVSATNDQKSAGQKHKHHKSNNNLAENHSHRHGSNQNQLAGESTVADSPTNESESTSYSHKRSHDWQDFSYGVEQKDSYAHSWSVPMAGSKRKY